MVINKSWLESIRCASALRGALCTGEQREESPSGCLLNVGVEMGFGRQLTLLGVPGQGLGVSEMNLPRIEQEGELW